MADTGKASEHNRRDWVIILAVLLFGFLCIILAGEWAIRFSPTWKLDTSMRSNLDPDSDFLTNRPVSFYEPLDPSILTQPPWVNVFLTPGASFETRIPPLNTPVATNTQVPTLFNSPTAKPPTSTPTVTFPSPTNTTPVLPPASTRTPASVPSSTPVTASPAAPTANLQITMSNGTITYTPGGMTTYTITIYNLLGPSNVSGALVTDTFPAAITSAAWTCSGAGGGTCTPSGTGNISDTVNLPLGSSITYTANASISPAATGNLVNMATVALPAGITDPNPANNTVTDTDTPLYTLDLRITKTDGLTSYTPGSTVTYTIVVTNPVGPANAVGALVTDTFPAAIASAAWTCAPGGGATCTASGGNDINDTVNLPVGGTLTYTVNADTDPAATTNLVNTATVFAPAGSTDTNPANNSATDTDTPSLFADLNITKTSGTTNYAASGIVSYTIDVSNAGPAAVTGATVTDIFPGQVASANWTCTPAGGATCPAAGTGDINHSVNLPAGGSLAYVVTAAIGSNPVGNLVNTARVDAPPAVTDTNPVNNFSTYTHVPYLDLQVAKDDGTAVYTPGGTTTYTVTVTNNSTFDLNGITVSDPKPSLVTSWGWCVAPCMPVATTSADLSAAVNLPAGTSVTYTILANVHPNAAGDLVNTATAAVPSGYVDSLPGNNSATDTDVNQNGEPELGPADGGVYPIGDGGSATFYLSRPIVANGDAAPDFVFHELLITTPPVGVYLDQVIVEISADGVTWYRVFFWGDNNPDTNTNVDNVNIANIRNTCPTEFDNCVIAPADLYNGTGITINVDPFAPAGNYNWIRFTEPGLTPGDGTHVDAIEILP